MRNKSLDALFPKTRQGILAATLVHPDRAWFASELARRLGVPSSSLQRELKELTAAGILTCRREGWMTFFQANSNSPLFPELRGLMLKTLGLVDVLSAALEPLSDKLHFAFVFGSIADSKEQVDSDIDLMVVGKATPLDLALPLRQAREQLGRDINPKVYTPAEFSRKRSAKDHFLTRVLDKPKLFVIGSSHELDKVVD